MRAQPLLAERARLEHWQAAARRAFGDETYAAAWDAGSRYSPEQAITEALLATEAVGALASPARDPKQPR